MSPSRSPSLLTVFLDNRHLLVLFIVITLVAGLASLSSLPRLEDPILTNRNPLVLTPFPGATAERVEAIVSEPLERTLREITEIKSIESTSQPGLAVHAIELEDSVTRETNERIFTDIRDKLGEVSARFPEGVGAPFLDDKRNAIAFTLIVSLGWEDGRERNLEILERMAEELGDRLRLLPGTELVRQIGVPEEEIQVWLDAERMADAGFTFDQVAQLMVGADMKAPTGVLRSEAENIQLDIQGAFETLQRIRQIPLRLSPEGGVLRVNDLADVERGASDSISDMAIRDGNRVVLVAARVQPQQRIDRWNEGALQVIRTFEQEAGKGIEVSIVFEQNRYTSSRLKELGNNLLLGAGAVCLVVFFTMGWRAALIIGSALPLTSALTLFLLAASGGQLHQMSIFGMIIALGLLIDNAIVVTDEVRKNLEAGESARNAVAGSIRYLFFPLLSSTLTTMLAFSPITLLPGPAGDFVSSIGSSVILALGSSFVLAMTVIAAVAGIYGHVSSSSRWWSGGMRSSLAGRVMRKGLAWCFRHRLAAIALGLIIPVLGFWSTTQMGDQFFPRTDRNMFEIEVYMPTGTSLDSTRAVTESIEKTIRARPEVRHVHWRLGGSFPTVYYNLIMDTDASPSYAHAIIETDHFDSTSRLVDQLQEELDQTVPEAQILVTKFAQGPPLDGDVEFRLVGPDLKVLQDVGEQIRLLLAEQPGIRHTRVSLPRGEPKLSVIPKEVEARSLGIGLRTLSRQLQSRLDGIQAGTLLEGLTEIPVRLRLRDSQRDSVQDIRNLQILSPQSSEEWIPLSAIARLEYVPTQGEISRKDGRRVNSIKGYARGNVLPIDLTNAVLAQLEASDIVIPEEYDLEVGGESEESAEAIGNLQLYMPLLIVATVAILILSFRSLRLGLLLITVAPLSVGYGLLATWLMGYPMSFNTIIGSLGLMGLAFNSSIVVLAAIRHDPEAAKGNRERIVDCVLGSGRHLLSTTLTTMSSFLPLLLLIGGEFWPPLAVVLFWGVGGSTLLALFFTPILYTFLGFSSPNPIEVPS